MADLANANREPVVALDFERDVEPLISGEGLMEYRSYSGCSLKEVMNKAMVLRGITDVVLDFTFAKGCQVEVAQFNAIHNYISKYHNKDLRVTWGFCIDREQTGPVILHLLAKTKQK